MAKGMLMTEIAALEKASVEELQKRYKELYGEDTASANKTYLLRKIAYRLHELEYGSLSIEAKHRLEELIVTYDPINNKTLRLDKVMINQTISTKDKRLPIPGTTITKEYKGSIYKVRVLEKGFEYNGKIYKSLTAIAYEITGSHWNGYSFFKM